MPQQTHTMEVSRPGADAIRVVSTFTASGGPPVDEVIPESSTDTLVNWAATVDDIQAILIVVDGPCTIKTNSDSEPSNTLTFAAAGRYEWTKGGRATEDALLLTSDVTALYVTSDNENRLRISCVVDLTPDE